MGATALVTSTGKFKTHATFVSRKLTRLFVILILATLHTDLVFFVVGKRLLRLDRVRLIEFRAYCTVLDAHDTRQRSFRSH